LTRRRAAWLLGAGVVILLTAVGARGVHATMPSAPLEIALESTGVVAVDADLTVTLTVRALVDAERLVLAITLPEGVDLVAGETEWGGPVRAMEDRVLSLTVRPRRAAPSVIQGSARIEFADGTVLGDVRSLTLSLGERSKQTLGLSPPQKTTTGESVIEFRDAP
jgi:hypothetical protein